VAQADIELAEVDTALLSHYVSILCLTLS